jgi:hypothetical protein
MLVVVRCFNFIFRIFWVSWRKFILEFFKTNLPVKKRRLMFLKAMRRIQKRLNYGVKGLACGGSALFKTWT